MSLKMLSKAGLVVCLIAGVASALMDPDLARRLEDLDNDAMLPVDFVLKEQFDSRVLASMVEGLPKPVRRARVGRILMDFAEEHQRELLAYLEGERAAGNVTDIRPLWLVNAVGCWAKKEVILAVNDRPDVELVYYDKMPVEITPVDLSEFVPGDAVTSVQPNLVVINARGAWAQGYTGQGVVIGVVDTGVRYTHDDLKNHLWTSTVYPNCGFNFASNQYSSGHTGPSPYDTLTPLDYYGHGTHCAGIATADGTYGNGTRDTMGVAPSAKIMSVPVDVYLHTPYPDTSMENNTMEGMQFCVCPKRDTLNGADLITMSLGLITSWLPRYAVWRRAEENILAAGIPHIVAAGNEGSGADKIRTPGNCPPPWPHPANHPTSKTPSAVITVGATDNNDAIASFSSHGPTRTWGSVAPWNDYVYPPGLMDPDVCAPGVNILSTSNSGDRSYTTMSGTSMATPGVAGCVALMLSKNMNLLPRQIDSILEMHAVKDLGRTGKDTVFGSGRINCSLAVAYTPLPRDVGCKVLLAPAGVLDSGTAVTPACSVYNYGNQAETYNVRMRIGTSYDTVANVSSHPAKTSVYVTFPQWTAQARGTWAVTCSTELGGDAVPANDKQSGSVRVRVMDAQCSSLLAPSGVVDLGAVVTPACSVYNSGTDTVTYTVRMKVGTTYDTTAIVTDHPPDEYVFVQFPDWVASVPGTHAVRCSTELAGDLVEPNNAKSGSVFVRTTDAGVLAIVAPVGVVDSGEVITPTAWVKNFGNQPVTVPVVLDIGTTYSDTQQYYIPAGDSVDVTFADWTALELGMHVVRCSTMLAGDMNSANDEKTDSVFVRTIDAGVLSIVAPAGVVDSGQVVTPQAWVRNLGNQPAAIPVLLEIGTTYADTQHTASIAPGDSALVTFADWTALTRGDNAVQCSTMLEHDMYPANNSLAGSVRVRVRDAAVAELVSPTGTVYEDTVIVPSAIVENLGTEQETFAVRLFIGAFYANETTMTVEPGAADTVWFEPWTAESLGTHPVRCSTALAGDVDPANDQVEDSVTVAKRPGVAGYELLPTAFALEPGRPTPFTRYTVIRYALPTASRSRVAVYDVRGRLMRTLVDMHQAAGWYSVVWDGCDQRGRRLAEGIYFCRMAAGDYLGTRRLILAR
ncbi:MAG: S8 family serine peptidase [candidate division WOR-3 bacterium]